MKCDGKEEEDRDNVYAMRLTHPRIPFSSQILAIKQVPVDTDLQEIIKEISIMQQCDSPYVVKYYGSYFKNTDLWVSWALREVAFDQRFELHLTLF